MNLDSPFCQIDSADPALRSSGCGLFSAAYVIDWASDGNGIPNTRVLIDQEVNRLRKLSGVSVADFNSRGTTLDEIELAIESYRVPDYLPIAMQKMHGGSLRDNIIPALKDGKAAWIAVRYGVIQEWKANPLSSFTGGHAIVIFAPVNGMLPTADPLRRTVINIPVKVIEHAMETFGSNPWGNGRGEAGVVTKTQTYREAYNGAKADLAKAKDQLATQVARAKQAIEQRDNARAAEHLAEQSVADLGKKLNDALAKIQELENNPPDCQPLVDAARAEGRAAMRDLIVLTTSGLT